MAHPINIITDIKVSAEFPCVLDSVARRFQYGSEEYWKQLEIDLNSAVRQFEGFLRDNRSQDSIRLDVTREIQTVCSSCLDLAGWETFEEDGKKFCAGCGEEVGAPPK